MGDRPGWLGDYPRRPVPGVDECATCGYPVIRPGGHASWCDGEPGRVDGRWEPAVDLERLWRSAPIVVASRRRPAGRGTVIRRPDARVR